MEKFAVIIPTRGDRLKLLDFAIMQLGRMTIKPDTVYVIDDVPAEVGMKDICSRVKRGVEKAKGEGFDKVYIIEDDDFYPPDYFELMAFDCDFVGCEKSLYYNISNNSYEYLSHKDRSSLYNTGFRISALRGFKWPDDRVTFLDIRLWRHAKRNNKKVKLLNHAVGVGIKHGIGLCGGTGHKRLLAVQDEDREVLKAHIDSEAFAFYDQLTTSIKRKAI